ncbi:Phospholipase D gamma 3 [Hibiscus syriacus]|uniref:phospholipase D n=1 Tax=Hibiscus syriacus TaxID=106335 RepID=A0A6A3BXG9_HIBSY|nr:Phospholipase D gamma 3 [Hibiscus syriacus]
MEDQSSFATPSMDPYNLLRIVQNPDGSLTRQTHFPSVPATEETGTQSNTSQLALLRRLIINQPYFNGVERTESENRFFNDRIFPLPANDLMWSLPPWLCRTELTVIMSSAIRWLLRRWDGCHAAWCLATAGIHLSTKLVEMLEARRVDVVAEFAEEGCHGIEIFDSLKAKTLFQSIEEFVYTTCLCVNVAAAKPSSSAIWHPPPHDWVKVNTDCGHCLPSGLVTCRRVLRDCEGAWVSGFAKLIGRCSALDAELWGILEGLSLPWDLGFRSVVVESDSKQGGQFGIKLGWDYVLFSKFDAAYVLVNFEERWLKSAKPHGLKKLKKPFDDALLRIERIPDIMVVSDFIDSESDPEGWHVQIFLSIDSNSVKGFPKDPKDATNKFEKVNKWTQLVLEPNFLVEYNVSSACAKAYVIVAQDEIINVANFLVKYIGADNLIPMEIALKIASKIKAKERFAAYIVLPMWPEGVPTGAATQRILFWQDYLNFFCLANRENDGSQPPGNDSPGSANTPESLGRKSRRFMIYVHSKGMIVDDEYVIVGYANFNQRSLEGTRDTEIAMGAYQPQYTWAAKHSSPLGQVYGYRMSLWAEHTGVVEDCFTRPESLDCVRRIVRIGKMNWKQFASEEVAEMRGH